MRKLALLFFAVRMFAIEPPADPKLTRVLGIKRLYIDRLSGGDTAAQIRDMIINSLQKTELFVLTENPDGADAMLRGSAEDIVYADAYDTDDSVGFRGSSTLPKLNNSSPSTSRRGGNFMSFGIDAKDHSAAQEHKHEASAAIRLVDRNGDVIWTTTQESKGAKFHGASADVADKVTKALLADVQKARNASESK